MFGAIAAAVAAIFGAVGQGWQRYQETRQVRHHVELEVLRARAHLAATEIEFSHRLSIAQIGSTRPWFKVFTFCLWMAPFVITIIFPEIGARIFLNLQGIPEWYAKACVVLVFATWGIAVSKNAITGIFAGMSNSWQQRKQIKQLTKEKEVAEIDKKALFDIIRTRTGAIDQDLVDSVNKILGEKK